VAQAVLVLDSGSLGALASAGRAEEDGAPKRCK
jgi:hypothetical protein